MYIQIDNAGFFNKGAELMLRAIIERVGKEKSRNAIFVAGEGCLGPTNNKEVRQAGLYQIPEFYRFHYRLDKLLPQFAFEPYGLAKQESIHVILDAGGFQFGDQWAKGYTKEKNQQLADYYQKYKKNGAKIIFLPQAFGPFDDPLSQERMKIVFGMADLIYARENTSLNHLHTLLGEHAKIKLAPDFTSLVEADLPNQLYEKVKDGVCLIPNARMTDKTSNEVAEKYLDYLIAVGQHILKKGEKLILLNHEAEGDWHLIQSIKEKLSETQNVVALNNLDAYLVKAVIGQSKLLISSRFHGVVSGLNQSIPTFCTSWSHKYEELLADYGLSGNLIDPLNISAALKKIDQALENPCAYTAAPEIIHPLKQKSEEMWKEVLEFF